VLCAALVTTAAMAAPPTLQTIAVTPVDRSIGVGKKQRFTATGTFSNGSTHTLGPAIADVAPGWVDTCALLTSGGVECWGDNQYGQLGDGTTTSSLIARPVKWITKATAVAVGRDRQEHACALLASGAVKCWGQNFAGELGDGTTDPATRPVRVTGISTATALALAQGHSCAVLASGRVNCWGYNYHGELGNGTNSSSAIPVEVTGISTAVAIAANIYGSCALLGSGAVQCWGDNTYGQLGNGTTVSSNTPVTASLGGRATAIEGGLFFSCALLASETVQCWGDGPALGNGTLGGSSVPVTVLGISTASAITTGAAHACAVLRNGWVQCWGANIYGSLGNGTTSPSAIPVRVAAINAPVRLMAGSFHTCALLSDGALRCWGGDDEGQLGNRRTTGQTPHPWPVNVIGTPGVLWQSSDPSRATISGRGLATGVAAGNTTMTATTAGFINDNAVLTVK
jgi:alpha-tubulin suppressor-like RCC1 family protein